MHPRTIVWFKYKLYEILPKYCIILEFKNNLIILLIENLLPGESSIIAIKINQKNNGIQLPS